MERKESNQTHRKTAVRIDRLPKARAHISAVWSVPSFVVSCLEIANSFSHDIASLSLW